MRDADRAELVARDPVSLVHRYDDADDVEVAGLIVAMLAYGRASKIIETAGRVLDVLGKRPARSIDRGRVQKLEGFTYRFQKGDDLVRFLRAIGRVRRRHGTLRACFTSVAGDEPTYLEAMDRFVQVLTEAVDGPMTYGLRYLLPKNGAKRICLYLRWMVRPADGLDLGVWPLERARLVIPLDTHIVALSGFLGFTERKSAGVPMALEVTEALSKMRPDDPLVYDMALCHLGISGQCKKRYVPKVCAACPIKSMCRLVPPRSKIK